VSFLSVCSRVKEYLRHVDYLTNFNTFVIFCLIFDIFKIFHYTHELVNNYYLRITVFV